MRFSRPTRGFASRVDEVGNRDQAGRSLNSDQIELLDVAILFRQTHDDVDFLGAVVGPVVAQVHAVGQHAHIAADQADIGVELCGLGAVDRQFPLDAGNLGAVLDVDETADVGHRAEDALNRRFDQ